MNREVAAMGKRNTTPLPPALKQQADVLRARRSLDELDECRLVAKSVASGSSHQAVAKALGISQAKVSRLLKKSADQPAIAKPTVGELVDRAVAKQMTQKDVLAALLQMKIPYVNPQRKPDSDWAKVISAYRSGILKRSAAQKLAEDAAQRLVGSVNRSMDLEALRVPSDATQRMLREATEKVMSSL